MASNQTEESSASYRILGTLSTIDPHEDDAGVEEEDPMAWADLEAFGGTKKTLEKTPPKPRRRKLTPEEVKDQLKELKEIDHKMNEAAAEKKSKKGMLDTIAWLKKHSEEDAAASANTKRRQSSSFVHSVLGFFQRKSSQDNEDEAMTTSSTDEPLLPAPWGQKALHCDWSELGFTLLNQPILDDIALLRSAVSNDALSSATAQAIIALANWLQRFDEHVGHVVTLKEYLLEERTLIAGVGYKVTTIYDSYKDAHRNVLDKLPNDKKEAEEAILLMCTDLETILKDEVVAVQDVITQTLSEQQEYEALSSLFHQLSDDESCGVIVAKLLGWMKKNLTDDEVQAFLALFDGDLQDQIAGEWMRHYAAYLHLLDDFSVAFEGKLTTYFT